MVASNFGQKHMSVFSTYLHGIYSKLNKEHLHFQVKMLMHEKVARLVNMKRKLIRPN